MDTEDFSNIMQELEKKFLMNYEIGDKLSSVLREKLLDAPDQAIQGIVGTFNDILNEALGENKAFAVCMAGIHESHSWPIYNAVGTVYPYLNRKQKDTALKELFRIFDGLNYAEVNGMYGVGHTTGIKEPALLSDIAIACNWYWPTLQDEVRILKDFSSMDSFMNGGYMDPDGTFTTKVKSDFLMAYTILRNDFTAWGDDYLGVVDQDFLERTVKGIVAIRFPKKEEHTPEEIQKGLTRLTTLLPAALHDKLDAYRKEADWVDYKLIR